MKIIGIIKDSPITGVQYGLVPQPCAKPDYTHRHAIRSVKTIKAQCNDFRQNRFFTRHK